MRTLKFIVNKQIITLDPSCDLSGLIPGSEGYLRAEFSFSSEWKNCVKVAAFYSFLGKEYQPQLLEDGKTCMITAEALKGRRFKVQVIGKDIDKDLKITTNKVTVCQNGGKE